MSAPASLPINISTGLTPAHGITGHGRNRQARRSRQPRARLHLRDGVHLWSEELERRIDAISQRLNGFFVGRYDIRYSSEDDLRAGRNFQIIELNGAASEATSIYDARNSLLAAYWTLFRQWKLVFASGRERGGRGAHDLALLWRKWRETTALISTYPLAD